MLKVLASRFADYSPALLNPQQNSVFESHLNALGADKDADALVKAEYASEGFWLSPEDYMSKYRPYVVKDGVLMIPVRGVLLNGFPWATPFATGYPYIWEAFKRGMEDGNVKGIALIEHSPGGEVAGCFELVDRMHAMRGKKPIRAFAHEAAYSAAYAIASAADKIIVSKTGGVGSIGVVTMHVSYAKMLENEGIEVTFIHFGAHKVDGNPYESLSKDAKNRIQSRINELGEVFVATVARNRGMDAKKVRDTEALTYSASEAMSIGLADSVGPLDDAMAAYVADLETEEGDEQMSNASATPALTQADVDAARAAGVEEGRKAGIETGRKEGATAERDRIKAIIESDEGKKRPKAALSFAMKSDMDAESAASILADLGEEKAEKTEEKEDKTDASGQDFNAAMQQDKPVVGAGAGDKANKDDDADAILALAGSMGVAGLRAKK